MPPGHPAPIWTGGGDEPFSGQGNLPSSPLSQLVQNGYLPTAAPPLSNSPRQAYGMGAYAGQAAGRPSSRQHTPQSGSCGGCLPGGISPGGMLPSGGAPAVGSRQYEASYQQQNDPTYAGARKPAGYRVTHAPGGGSSISLSWGEPDQSNGRGVGGPALPSGLRGQRATPPQAASGMAAGARYRSPSPADGGGVRGALRASSPFYGGPGGAPQAPAALPSPSAAAGARGGGGGPGAGPFAGGGGVGYGMPPPLPRNPSVPGREEPSGMIFGGRCDARSSNAYANGANQNVGNYICDRRTTRVLQPPGGGSSISFG